VYAILKRKFIFKNFMLNNNYILICCFEYYNSSILSRECMFPVIVRTNTYNFPKHISLLFFGMERHCIISLMKEFDFLTLHSQGKIKTGKLED
jgi:hypothetical protein